MTIPTILMPIYIYIYIHIYICPKTYIQSSWISLNLSCNDFTTLQWQEGANKHNKPGTAQVVRRHVPLDRLGPTSDSVSGLTVIGTAIIMCWLIPSGNILLWLVLKMPSACLVSYLLSYCWRYGGEARPHLVRWFKNTNCYGRFAPVWCDVCKVGLDEIYQVLPYSMNFKAHKD